MTLSTVAEKAAPEKKARCFAADCKKKLSAIDFDCRCGHRFCGLHRQAEDHKCTHNWKADGHRVLGQQLQLQLVMEVLVLFHQEVMLVQILQYLVLA